VAIEGDRSIWAADPFGTELLELTVGDLLDQQAARFADREALVCVDPEFGLDVRWSYAALQSRVDHLARAGGR
jgi:acyl-CoA synthetase (AMP-forming)/AMP-acid ligase II